MAVPERTLRIIDGMRWLEEGRVPMPWRRALVAYASEHSPTGGAFTEGTKDLRELGWILWTNEGFRGLVLEQDGRSQREVPSEPYSRQLYLERVLRHVSEAEAQVIARLLLDTASREATREQLFAACHAEKGRNGSFRMAMNRLLRHELVEPVGAIDLYRATDALWPLSVFERRALESHP